MQVWLGDIAPGFKIPQVEHLEQLRQEIFIIILLGVGLFQTQNHPDPYP
jgi:hypothetical protein